MINYFMQIYVLIFPQEDGGWQFRYCSINRKKLLEYASSMNLDNFELDTRSFNFNITDVDRIYSVNTNSKNPKIFIDFGRYFKTNKEATIELKKLSTPQSRYKYLVEPITVIK